MIGFFLGLALQAASTSANPQQVITCYLQEDDLGQRDPSNPGNAHLGGPKYLIAWKYAPLAAFGISKAPIEVHDPHGFLQGNRLSEQAFNSKGMGFFAGEPNKDTFVIGVMPDQTTNGMHRSQFIRTTGKKITSMAFGYCKADERDADAAFAFWKVQSETLP